MASSHLKRIVAPKTWPILRKTTKFIARPKPNGQEIAHTLPVVVVLRDMLGLVATAAQAKRILRSQPVTVNGRRVYDTDSAIGFMDVLAIGGHAYRVLLNQNNVLTLKQTKEDLIIQKITGKTVLPAGKVQLNCQSGRNLIVAKDTFKVNDSIALGRDGKVSAHYALAKGASVLLTGGSHIGKVGTVEEVKGAVITVRVGEESVETATRHAYVVGTGKPAIALQ